MSACLSAVFVASVCRLCSDMASSSLLNCRRELWVSYTKTNWKAFETKIYILSNKYVISKWLRSMCRKIKSFSFFFFKGKDIFDTDFFCNQYVIPFLLNTYLLIPLEGFRFLPDVFTWCPLRICMFTISLLVFVGTWSLLSICMFTISLPVFVLDASWIPACLWSPYLCLYLMFLEFLHVYDLPTCVCTWCL